MYGRLALPATDICEKYWLRNRYLISDCYNADEGNRERSISRIEAAVNLAVFTGASGSFAAAVRSFAIRIVGSAVHTRLVIEILWRQNEGTRCENFS
jgi:hypothetical protein